MVEKKGSETEASVSRAVDMEALQRKINTYSDMLYRIAFLQLKNNQDAEDVVQETFYQFVKRKVEFETPEHRRFPPLCNGAYFLYTQLLKIK